jgi:DNA-binding response OmpR family regulator
MRKCAALVIDDDEDVQQLLHTILRKHCSHVERAFDGARAAELLRAEEFELVILDLMLPKMNGFEVAKVIESLPKQPKLIVLSAISRYFDDRFPEDAVILQKPADIDRIDQAIVKAQQQLEH